MNIRAAVFTAVFLAYIGKDRPGYLHRVYVMETSPKWSLL